MISGRETSDYELVTVKSGARSLRARAHGETFHPVVGPMQEATALHVEGQRLVERAGASPQGLVIWDVGLGAAANAIAALEALRAIGAPAELHSFDCTLAPLAFACRHAAELGYLLAWQDAAQALLKDGSWSDGARRWMLHAGDFRERMKVAPVPEAILYDPYSPRANPDLWTLEHFTALRAKIGDSPECLLTNYTRSTAVRVTLLLAGFFVGRGGATGEKDETTVAATGRALLDRPLGADWLQRVRRSTQGAPLRAAGRAAGAISDTDWATLCAHPQFSKM